LGADSNFKEHTLSIEFGVDYYPEQWDRTRWETDARLMSELGVDVVRMGEFSWFKFESAIGRFDFDWLDEAIDLLARYGIKTIIGTPTAAPPRWLITSDESILPVDANGITRGFGGRHHDCHSNRTYRIHCKRIVLAMANHFRDNPDVIGWQIDNELGNSHDNLCTCQSCQLAFQGWLENRYHSIDALNNAWGTCFWSQNYDAFSQIPVPRITPNSHNPSLLLDWKRFCSDLIVDFAQDQIEIIREKCPHQFITHNLLWFSDKVNYYDLGQNLDFVAHDQYPEGYWFLNEEKTPSVIASMLDFIRAVKRKTFWIMEQQSGMAGWELLGKNPRPGQLALWTAQSVAHGADTVVFFRWRTCTFGTEEFWHGILPHNGVPGRRYEEIRKVIAQLRPVMHDVNGKCPKGEIAIVFDYDQEWALRIQPHHPKLNYISAVRSYYEALYRKNIPTDFINPKDDFVGYKVIIAPLHFILDTVIEKKLRRYVEEGGALILTMRTGVKTEANTCRTDGSLPCGLVDVMGIEILDYDCLRDFDIPIVWASGNDAKDDDRGSWWSDILNVHRDTEILATYGAEFYRNTAAITMHNYGKGSAYYVATQPSPSLMKKIIDRIIFSTGLKSLMETANGIEATHRTGDKYDYLFILNHNDISQDINVPELWSSISGDNASEIMPYGIRIYQKRKNAE
jgi:beta-galactosidase